MKANELRIGNYVWLKSHHYPVQVEQIFKYHDNSIWIGTDLHEGERLEDYEPIELTEEWHIKYGVKINGFNDYVYVLSDIKAIVFSGDYVFIRDFYKNINSPSMEDNICTLWNNDARERKIFVHEWQNLYFALTGEELTIKENE